MAGDYQDPHYIHGSATLVDREKLRKRLIAKEALKLDAYRDSLGYWTACVGHLLGKEEPEQTEFTPEQCSCFLEKDIDTAEGLAQRYPFYKLLSDARQNIVVELSFNLGHKLDRFDRFLHFMWTGEFALAGAALKDSLAYKQEKRRFDEIIKALEAGDYP